MQPRWRPQVSLIMQSMTIIRKGRARLNENCLQINACPGTEAVFTDALAANVELRTSLNHSNVDHIFGRMKAALTGSSLNMRDIVNSKMGFQFTPRTVDVMRDYFRTMRRNGCKIISYAAAVYSDGVLRASLGADFSPQPNAIRDEVAGIEFYWYVDESILSTIRPLIIDTPPDAGTRLLKPTLDRQPDNDHD